MHDQARKFTIFIKNSFPEFFHKKQVLDVDSGHSKTSKNKMVKLVY
jgi:hypothetical protein